MDAGNPTGAYIRKCAAPTPTPTALAASPARVGATPLPGAPGCPLTVAVYGNALAQTRYVATAFRTGQLLTDGVPSAGNVEPVAYSQYVFTAVDRTPITVTVTPTSGDPDLYVALNGQPAWSGNYQWFSQINGPGVESVLITWEEPFWAGVPVAFPFDFTIGVTGWDGPATYFITAATASNTTAIPLVGAVPTGATLAAGRLTLFSVYVPPPSPRDPGFFNVDVVPLQASPAGAGNGVAAFVSGSFDLASNRTFPPVCRGRGGACANASSPTGWAWTSLTGGSPLGVSVSVVGTFPRFRNDMTYVLGVYSPVDTPAVLTATRSGDVTFLQAGVGVPLTLPPGGQGRFFILPFNGSFTPTGALSPDLQVELTLTVATGDANIYASGNTSNTKPNPLAYQFASSASGAFPDAIIMPSTAFACGVFQCAAFVGVFPAPNVGGVTTQATLTAVVQNVSAFRPALLAPGVPAQGAVPPRGAAYFTIPARQAVDRLDSWSVVMSPASGNPDVYVRVGGVPSPQAFDWSSTTTGVDSIKVVPGEPGFCGNCTINIAVIAGPGEGGGAPPAASFALWFAFTNTSVVLLNGLAYAEAGLTPLRSRYFVLPVGDAAADVSFALTGRGLPPVQWFLAPWPGNATSAPGGGAGMPMPDVNGTACRRTSTVGGVASLVVRGGAAFADPCHCVGCSYVLAAYCPNRACSVGVTGSMGSPLDVTPLADGVAVPGAVPRWGWAYFSFDYAAYPDRRNLTVTVDASLGRPALFATNTFYRGFSDASALPSNASGGFVWSAPPGAPLVIPADDPALAACGNCTDVTLGVWGGDVAATAFTITALSAGSLPRLALGVPSPLISLPAGGATAFEFVLPAVDAAAGDLVVTATVLAGSVYLSVDPLNASLALCAPGAPGSPNTPGATCRGVWATNVTTLRVPADAPCGSPATNPDAAGGPCNPASAWRRGVYYLGAFAAAPAGDGSPARLSLLVSQVGAGGQVISLLPGQPVSTYAQPEPLPPTVLVFASAAAGGGTTPPPVRFFTLSRSVLELVLYVNSCPASRCSAELALPGPGSFTVSSYADPGGAVNVVLDGASRAFCAPPDAGDPCLYFLRVLPLCPGGPGTCAGRADFDVFAVTEDGSSPVLLTAPSVGGSAVSEQLGSLPALFTSTQFYELYTGVAPGGPPANVTLLLESGGPIFSSVYVCDPTLPAGGAGACAQPYAPAAGPGRHTAALYTSQPGTWWPRGTRGRGALTLTTRSPVVILGAVADDGNARPAAPAGAGAGQASAGGGHSRDGRGAEGGGRGAAPRHTNDDDDGRSPTRGSMRGGGGGGGAAPGAAPRGLQSPLLAAAGYTLLATTGSSPLVLEPPPATAIALSDVAAPDVYSSVTVTVTVAPPTLAVLSAPATAAAGGRPVTTPLTPAAPLALTYSVYYAPGSFNPPGAANPPFMAFNPSGLARWAYANGFVPPANVTPTPGAGGAVTLTLPMPLPERSQFEFNVVATCDEGCMAAALPPGSPPGRPAAQSVAYAITAYNTVRGRGGSRGWWGQGSV